MDLALWLGQSVALDECARSGGSYTHPLALAGRILVGRLEMVWTPSYRQAVLFLVAVLAGLPAIAEEADLVLIRDSFQAARFGECWDSLQQVCRNT